MAEGDDDDIISSEEQKEVRRLQELFRGRFSENDAATLYKHCNKNLLEAVDFVFKGDPAQIRNITDDGVVSKCKLCRQKYDAIPRENEYGWARHTCNNCGNEFHGFGAMNRTRSPCYNCWNVCTPVEVVPPFKRRRRRTRNKHSCTASNCCNRTPDANRSGAQINFCVHPLSTEKRVLHPSQQHVSTGSTVDTFLDQDDLESFCQYEPSLASITESTNENDSSD
ncbi:hypothetical protein ACJMK2_001085 [Sinanodonta woodiana]|uniref:Uncharacterized protein n=1 Tax=Sinanodonta woodiana TaxID=1069815 RepID=A0ABD3XR64_SINWO